MNRWTRGILSILLLTLVPAVTACGDDDSTGPDDSLTGTFNLSTVNGSSLPFVLFEDGEDREEVTAGVATFASGGTFTSTLTFRSTVAGETTTDTDTATGTYTRSGNTVTLTIPDDEDSPYQATLSGNSLTLTVDGFSFRFDR